MAYDGIRITAPVTMTDIHNCFGVTGGLGASCVASRDSVNIWAKYKWQHHPNNGPLNDAMRKAYNYGICNIPKYSRLGEMLDDVKDGTTSRASARGEVINPKSGRPNWGYDYPTGGIGTSPYRMLDCAGYWRYAQAPIGQTLLNPITRTSGTAYIGFSAVSYPQDGQLGLADIQLSTSQLNLFYPTILLWNASHYIMASMQVRIDGEWTFITMAQAQSTYGISFRITDSRVVGTWNAIVFLSSEPTAFQYDTLFETTGQFVPIYSSLTNSLVIQDATYNIDFGVSVYRATIRGAVSLDYVMSTTDNNSYAYSGFTCEWYDSGNTLIYTQSFTIPGSPLTPSSPKSGTLTLATASVVSANALYNAVSVKVYGTVGPSTVRSNVTIVTGGIPPGPRD